jgi:hypothetical protein
MVHTASCRAVSWCSSPTSASIENDCPGERPAMEGCFPRATGLFYAAAARTSSSGSCHAAASTAIPSWRLTTTRRASPVSSAARAGRRSSSPTRSSCIRPTGCRPGCSATARAAQSATSTERVRSGPATAGTCRRTVRRVDLGEAGHPVQRRRRRYRDHRIVHAGRADLQQGRPGRRGHQLAFRLVHQGSDRGALRAPARALRVPAGQLHGGVRSELAKPGEAGVPWTALASPGPAGALCGSRLPAPSAQLGAGRSASRPRPRRAGSRSRVCCSEPGCAPDSRGRCARAGRQPVAETVMQIAYTVKFWAAPGPLAT